MKSNNLYNNSLYTFFCSNNSSNILFSLKEFDGIDVLYQNGFFFSCAISKGNVEVCKALITYFEDKQFPVKDRKYEEAKEKLIEILENATDNIELSFEMKEILSPYIDFEGSDKDTINDFLDNYQENLDIHLSTEKAAIKKAHSMNDLKDHYDKKSNTTHDNSQEKLLSLDLLNKLQFVMQDTDYNNKDEIHSAGEIDYHYDSLLHKEHHTDLAGNLLNSDEL